ncbi:dsDNA nuclease domain-containing protein (plasmid) [Rhizobium sp. CB3060]|uniref:dsDNA nuclease domain-containing protein n=1 Tax=Rhizobium sp. CB3060 TaxID=3138255 RepID=UPI0021A48631|nr:dsDNA nuclease domain-containing protein [Rhizobium tropici]UWU26170.1 dsDNA nuclease domain-containing protein [Rhizobium tropici]
MISGTVSPQRNRAQAAVMALYAIKMLNYGSPIKELYTELHEDFLARLKTDRYIFFQVKTRSLGLPAFSLDHDIKTALANFVLKDSEFPNLIDQFVLISNIGFQRKKRKGSVNPYEFLSWSKRPIDENDACRSVAEEIAKIASKRDVEGSAREFTIDQVRAAMKRVDLRAELFEPNAIVLLVLAGLLKSPLAGLVDPRGLLALADDLINDMFNRAALGEFRILPGDIDPEAHFDTTHDSARILSRRVDRASLEKLISNHLNDDRLTLKGMVTKIAITPDFEIDETDESLRAKIYHLREKKRDGEPASIECNIVRLPQEGGLELQFDDLARDREVARQVVYAIGMLLDEEVTRNILATDSVWDLASAVRAFVISLNPLSDIHATSRDVAPYDLLISSDRFAHEFMSLPVDEATIVSVYQDQMMRDPFVQGSEERDINAILLDQNPYLYVSDLPRPFLTEVVLPRIILFLYLEERRSGSAGAPQNLDVSGWLIRFEHVRSLPLHDAHLGQEFPFG